MTPAPSAPEFVRDRLVKGRTAAVLYGSGATVGLLAVLLPHWTTLRPLGVLAPVTTAYLVTCVLLLWSPRLTDWVFHGLPVAGAILISVALLSTGNAEGGSTFAALYVFPTIYACAVFPWRQAALHSAWVAACYGGTVLAMPGQAPMVRWVFTTGACFGAGSMVAWLVMQRSKAEVALRDSEASFRLLFANNPQPMWVYDRFSLRFLEVNDAAVQRYGWSRDEFLRMSLQDIRPEEDVPRLLEAFASAERPALVESDGWRHRLRDGTVIDVDIRAHSLDFRGTRASVAVAIDVTERKRAEEMLVQAYNREREAAQRLRALDDVKNNILQAVSHDLRTPLAIVLGIAMTLQERGGEMPPEMVGRLVDRLASGAKRLERLLSGLLDLDRLTRGIVEPNRDATDVVALTRRVAAECELRNVNVRVQPDAVVANVDVAKVERIVENLVANADRHTPTGTNVWIRASSTPRQGVLLTVEDDGPGVPDELKPVVFDAFRQGGPKHSPGSGIGLALVAQFAKLHGGRAWIEDRQGGGACFKVLLPGEAPVATLRPVEAEPTARPVAAMSA